MNDSVKELLEKEKKKAGQRNKDDVFNELCRGLHWLSLKIDAFVSLPLPRMERASHEDCKKILEFLRCELKDSMELLNTFELRLMKDLE